MKNNKNPNNGAHSVDSQLVPVCFEFTDPTASTVCVAGTFNQWQPEAKTLHSEGGGRWMKEIVLAPGTYEYCIVVDNQWMPDPQAVEDVPNPFGGKNSILKVTLPSKAAPPVAAKKLPQKKSNIQNTKQRKQLCK